MSALGITLCFGLITTVTDASTGRVSKYKVITGRLNTEGAIRSVHGKLLAPDIQCEQGYHQQDYGP